MKVQQNTEFQPITITLETRDEADLLWYMVSEYVPATSVQKEFKNRISDWFSNQAQL